MNKTDGLLIEENQKLKEFLEKLQSLLTEKNSELKYLKQENNLLRQIFDHLPGRIFCKNTDGKYIVTNRQNIENVQHYRLLENIKLESFLGKTDKEIFPEEMATIYRQTDLEVIDSKNTLRREYNYPNKDGKFVIEAVNKVPLLDEQGEVMGVLGYCFDITYLKDLETKLKNAGIAKIEFIRHMQHDIKTPFTGITGLTDILLDRETDLEKREFLKDIILCANELMEYCSRILDFSKTTVKNLPFVTTEFKLRDIVDSVINIALPVAKIKQLNLSLNYDAESLPVTVIGYPHRLKSILVNLLNNALQYTQQGQIYLRVKSKTVIDDSVLVQFIIKDTGQGMLPEKQAAIEKQLNAVPVIENDTYEGRGLGLRIVSQFAQDISGKVLVESKLGEGTTFTVEIPLREKS
jgi:two-component system, OmpR family, aerobic respiration control sensor histidine kinase ArcB